MSFSSALSIILPKKPLSSFICTAAAVGRRGAARGLSASGRACSPGRGARAEKADDLRESGGVPTGVLSVRKRRKNTLARKGGLVLAGAAAGRRACARPHAVPRTARCGRSPGRVARDAYSHEYQSRGAGGRHRNNCGSFFPGMVFPATHKQYSAFPQT